MSIPAKTQATPTPAPVVTTTTESQSLFESQETQSDKETATESSRQLAASACPPPEDSLQRAVAQGHHFRQIEIANHQPAIQRSEIASVNERWEDGAVSLKPMPENAMGSLAAKVSPYDEKWEDGAVTLKADSIHSTDAALQRDGDGSFAAGAKVESQLNSSKGGGKPLSEGTRDFMESRFGNDFGQVRIHDNAEAIQMSQDLKAQAFTHGNDIYFNSGKYKPESSSGKRLLAHELTHTIQQTGPSAVSPKRLAKKAQKPSQKQNTKSPAQNVSPVEGTIAPKRLTVQTQLMVGAPGDRYEQEADRMADRVMSMPTVSLMPEESISLAPEETVSLMPLGVPLSDAPVNTLQRNKKKKIKKDVRKAVEGIKEEVESKKDPKSETAEGEKGAKVGEDLADEAKSKLGNANSESKAKKEGKKLKKKAKQKSKEVRDEADVVEEKEDKKQAGDQAKIRAEEVAEAKKQQKEEEKTDPTKEDGKAVENPKAESDASIDSGEKGENNDQPVAPTGEPEKLPDPGPISAPKKKPPKAPTSPDEDPAFDAAIKQSEHVAAEQSAHKPAETKAQEAQDAAVDPAQQSRRAQSTQANEAGEQEPKLFDREAFVSSLLSALESNKPKSQKDVEKGKGMDGASEQMGEEIAKAKEGSGGDLTESATREPDLESEAPKPVIPTPSVEEETGEKPPDELIDAEAATPKVKSEEEIEKPLKETHQAIATLIPKDKKDLPPIQAKPIQTKLTVGAPGDRYEQEADLMADKVMAMSEPATAPDPKTKPKTEPKTLATPAKGNKIASPAPAAPAPASVQPQTNGPTEQSESGHPQDSSQDSSEDTETEGIQRQLSPDAPPEPLPEVQLLPGLFLQRKATIDPETLTQEKNPVPLDEHRLKSYEKEAGVNATGAIAEGEQHFGGEAQHKFRQAESAKISDTKSEQAQNISGANESMFATRMAQISGVQETQQDAQTQDESDRCQVTQAIQDIYGETKTNVNEILARMDQRVNHIFKQTDKRAKKTFERRQKQLFKQWKKDYYGVRHPMYIPWMEVKTGWAYVKIRFVMKPFFNTPLWLVNSIFTGLPKEVNEIYEEAREDYLAVQREGVHVIADVVEEEMNNAKAEVDRGRERVKAYVDTLPEDLKSVGAEAASNIQAQFDSLESDIQAKQHSLVDDLKTKYEESLKEIDERIEELKAANASLVSKIASAIADIGKWILKKVISVLKPVIAQIPGIGSKAGKFLDAFVDDPGGIMKTLFKGLGEGFKNFGKNIMKHMINGFFEWLLGSGVPIVFPDKFDLQGVLDILLQMLGVSKNAIFHLASMLLPTWAVELLEMLMDKGMGALSGLMDSLEELGVPSYVMGFFKALASFPQKGIMALWDFLKTMFSSLKGEFITTILTQLVIPEVVVAGIQWMVGLLNPVGGIYKIVKGIVDVVTFLIDNRALIMSVLQSIGATFAALIDKSWGPIAIAVEFALAKIIPLALGLFISLLGLGGIPKKITKVVEKLRAPVDKGLSKILSKIGFLLDPVGTIENGVSGVRDRAASKRNQKKGKKDDDDNETSTNKTSTSQTGNKTTGQTSTKNASNPPNAKSSTNQKTAATAGGASSQKGKTNENKSKKDQDKDKKKKDKDKNAKGDDSKQRLSSAMKAVDKLSESKRDPDAVKKELAGVKKKHDLDSIKLTKSGKEKYKVVGKAKAKTSKKGGKVQRKASKGASKGNWTDDQNQVTVKKRLKASKTKGGSFTLDAKLIEKDAVLKKVETNLKRLLKINARIDVVTNQVKRLKAQYKLKELKVIKLRPDGKYYLIEGEISQGKSGKSAQRKATSGSAPGAASGSASNQVPQVTPQVEQAIQRAEGSGQEIAPAVREPMENAFGMDFSPVRIHIGNEGNRLSQTLQAKAFTTGRDIFFTKGAYQPETSSGRHLLAHELTHVVQQSGEQPSVMPQRIQRSVAEPSTTNQTHPSMGQWIQRAEDNTTETEQASESPDESSSDSSGPSTGAMVGAVAQGAASVGGSMVADAAINKVASELMPGAKVKSRITNNKSKLTMNVQVKDRDITRRNRDRDDFEDDISEESGLPSSLVNDIVRTIQDIVNQNPDPDAVARKLNAVRVMFEMQLVKLISYAEVGDSFEYVIKINGRAKFIRASKIKSFLKRLGSGKRKTAPPLGEESSDRNQSTKSKRSNLEEDTTEKPETTKPQSKTKATSKSPSKPAAELGSIDTPESTSAAATEKSDTDGEKAIESIEGPPSEKVKPSSSTKASSSKAKLEQAEEREIDTQSKVRRIDAETVDVIIRANPQTKTV